MKTIKKVSAISVAKLLGLMQAVIGFVLGLFMFIAAVFSNFNGEGAIGLIFGIAAPIFLPILYGLMGWVTGYLFGALYNLFAKTIGGIKVEVE